MNSTVKKRDTFTIELIAVQAKLNHLSHFTLTVTYFKNDGTD